jgi:hypothetical protein
MLGITAVKLRAHLQRWRTLLMVAILTSCTLAPATATANEPPELLSFDIVHVFGDYWLIYGEVDDESPQYCLIGFGGVLDGYWTEADSDGTYSYVVELPPSLVGYITAQAMDSQGQYSNVLEGFLYQ